MLPRRAARFPFTRWRDAPLGTLDDLNKGGRNRCRQAEPTGLDSGNRFIQAYLGHCNIQHTARHTEFTRTGLKTWIELNRDALP